MTARTTTTYCRLCPAACGLVVELDEHGDVTHVKGDEQHALTRGFTCTKGRHIAEFHRAPNRLRTSQRRTADGGFEPITPEVAIAEIASRLQDIIAEHGPDAVALYTGTQAAMASLTLPFTLGFWKALGSQRKFSSMTVDQAAKWVADARMGRWAAGQQRFADADVWMLVGTNPLISMQGGGFTAFPIHDGLRRLDEERKRGLQLIVVDPRRTELATRADIHLQLIPGTDALLFAAIIRTLLDEGLHDHEFCTRWAPGLDALRAAVAPFTPEAVAERCGVAATDIVRAARVFGRARSGMVTSGTGPDMGPDAELAEHLLQAVNVVCGRFPREGDALAGTATLGSAKALPAQAISPDRHWERATAGATGFHMLNGELPAVSLPDEILTDSPTRIRALIVSGGNPAVAVPGKARMTEAFAALDLLVTVDPFMSETAALADYVIAPVVHLERPDTTRSYEGLMDRPFAQYTAPVVTAPDGVIDDWEFFVRLAGALGRPMKVAGRDYLPGEPMPSTDDVLASFAGRGRVSFAEVKAAPHGRMFETLEPVRATAPTPDASGAFDVAPADVVAELQALAEHLLRPHLDDGRLLLVVRRVKEVMNSTGTQLPALVRTPPNPCHVHPDDLARLGLADGAEVTVTSDHGRVTTWVRADATLRPGVASMTHGFGGAGDRDPHGAGASTNRLLSATADLQPISGMPLMSAVPVALAAV